MQTILPSHSSKVEHSEGKVGTLTAAWKENNIHSRQKNKKKERKKERKKVRKKERKKKVRKKTKEMNILLMNDINKI